MGIETGNSDLIGDLVNAVFPPPPELARGRVIRATGKLTHLSSASSGSKYLLIRVPSYAILTEMTLFDVENLGFATVNIGTASDLDALITIAKSSGNTVTPIVFGDAHHGKHLWEVLGLSADPGGDIELYLTASGDATGAGSMPFQIEYLGR